MLKVSIWRFFLINFTNVFKGLAFVSLTMIQLEHSVLSRSVHDTSFSKEFYKNKWILGAFAVSSALLIIGIYTPGISTILEQTPLKALDWALVIIGMMVHVFNIEMMKVYLRRRRRKQRDSYAMFYSDV